MHHKLYNYASRFTTEKGMHVNVILKGSSFCRWVDHLYRFSQLNGYFSVLQRAGACQRYHVLTPKVLFPAQQYE